MLKSPKTKILADGLIKRTSMLDEIASETVHIKTGEVIDRGKRSKTLTEVKLVRYIFKNL